MSSTMTIRLCIKFVNINALFLATFSWSYPGFCQNKEIENYSNFWDLKGCFPQQLKVFFILFWPKFPSLKKGTFILFSITMSCAMWKYAKTQIRWCIYTFWWGHLLSLGLMKMCLLGYMWIGKTLIRLCLESLWQTAWIRYMDWVSAFGKINNPILYPITWWRIFIKFYVYIDIGYVSTVMALDGVNIVILLNPCPAEPGYIVPLQTV